MSAALLPSLAFAIRLAATPAAVDFGYGAAGEVAGGSIPLSAEETFTPAAEAYFELRTGMRLTTPTSTLVLRYAPRLFARLPGTEQLGRPLLFNTLTLSALTQASPRWTLSLSGTAGAGEVAYSGLRELFPSGTGVVPVSTVSIMTGTLIGTSSYRATRRNTLHLSLRTNAQAPLYSEDPLPSYRSAGASIGDEYRASPRDTLTLGGSATYYVSSDFGELAVLGVDGSALRRLSPTSELLFQGGASAFRATDGVAADEPTRIFPTGSVAYSTRWGSRTERWAAQVRSGAQGLFDQLRFDYRAVGFVGADVTATFESTFTTGVSASVSTSLTRHPNEELPFETLAHLALPSSYALSDRFDLLFGARTMFMAPHASELFEPERQAQFMLYVGFRHRDGTAPSRGAWLD